MILAVRPDPAGPGRRAAGWVTELTDDATATGPPRWVADLAPLGAAGRWLWSSTAEHYPTLLAAGVRVDRCHDVELVEALLLGHEGRWGEPRSLAAALARLTGAPVPPDPAPRVPVPPGDGQGSLFDLADAGEPPRCAGPPPAGADPDPLAGVLSDQRARAAGAANPGRLRLLLAAESAGALVAAEMGHAGLPVRADRHDALLRELLGERSVVGGPPRRVAELATAIGAALGDQRLHPDSPAEVLRAFSRLGIILPSTRAHVLQQVDHPAVALLLEYKELYRLWTAHGWSWREQWVREGRFHPEYVPGGVVSGRWATRGGGALQIPRVVRRAVVADPGWTFVVADAGQLEPRVLAAVSGDQRLAAAAATGDLYRALAAEAFGGDRARAKVALLGAMYGQTGGQALPALAALRRRYPAAWEYVEAAARAGEAGELVRSWLGRTCPPPAAGALEQPAGGGSGGGSGGGVAGAAARARGRFTRNFVIQATAAEWALVLLARLRTLLAAMAAELVFFQHDEVVVHCPAAEAPEVAAAVLRAGDEARELLFGATSVRFPLDLSTVECYADAK